MKLLDFFKRKTAKHSQKTRIILQPKGFRPVCMNVKIRNGELKSLISMCQRNDIDLKIN